MRINTRIHVLHHGHEVISQPTNEQKSVVFHACDKLMCARHSPWGQCVVHPHDDSGAEL